MTCALPRDGEWWPFLPRSSSGSLLLLLDLINKQTFPLLHRWLTDAFLALYPSPKLFYFIPFPCAITLAQCSTRLYYRFQLYIQTHFLWPFIIIYVLVASSSSSSYISTYQCLLHISKIISKVYNVNREMALSIIVNFYYSNSFNYFVISVIVFLNFIKTKIVTNI